jgi:HSP20 family molecular chaperone IbpA
MAGCVLACDAELRRDTDRPRNVGRMWATRARRSVGLEPPIDLVRENGYPVVRADVLGFQPDEIVIEVEDGMLMVSGKQEEA